MKFDAQREKKKVSLFFIVLFLLVAFFIAFPRLSLPFGLSYIAYITLSPLQSQYRAAYFQKRIFLTIGLVLGVCLFLLPVLSVVNSLNTDLSDAGSLLPKLQYILSGKMASLKVFARENFGFKIDIDPTKMIFSYLDTESRKLLVMIPNLLSTLFEWMILIPLFTFFFYKESKTVKKSFLKLIPNSQFERAYMLFNQFNSKFSDYITAKIIEATIVGLILIVGLSAIGFPYAALLGFVGGLTNILPYVGPVLGFVPALLVALIETDSQSGLLGVTVIFMIANLIDLVLVFPLLVSRIVNLHPMIVIVSVIVGSQLGGVIGMIISVPIAAFFKLVAFEIYKEIYLEDAK